MGGQTGMDLELDLSLTLINTQQFKQGTVANELREEKAMNKVIPHFTLHIRALMMTCLVPNETSVHKILLSSCSGQKC